MKRDRFKVIYDAAVALVSAGKVARATVLVAELCDPPREGESREYYDHSVALLNSLRPADAELWACEKSPDGFCHNIGPSGHCGYCHETVDRL